jgi:hypothetical protein
MIIAQPKHHRHSGLSFRAAFFIAVITTAYITAFPQGMNYSSTVYTDSSISADGISLYAWGTTYAPSYSSITHVYRTTSTVMFPSGVSAQGTSQGQDFNAANTFVSLSMTSDDVINGLEGQIYIASEHEADCSYFGGTFLATSTEVFGIGFATTTFKYLSSIPGPPNWIICFSTAECTTERCINS